MGPRRGGAGWVVTFQETINDHRAANAKNFQSLHCHIIVTSSSQTGIYANSSHHTRDTEPLSEVPDSSTTRRMNTLFSCKHWLSTTKQVGSLQAHFPSYNSKNAHLKVVPNSTNTQCLLAAYLFVSTIHSRYNTLDESTGKSTAHHSSLHAELPAFSSRLFGAYHRPERHVGPITEQHLLSNY